MVCIMEKNDKIRIYCLLAASFAIGILGAVCLFLGIAGEYDDAMGYFNVGSVFAPVVYCVLGAGVVLGLAGAVLFRRYSAPDEVLPNNTVTVAGSVVACLGILATTFADIASYTGVYAGNIMGITLLSWVLSFLCVASIAVNAFFSKKGTVKPWISLLSFSTVFFCAVKVLILYFDQHVAVNSPVKLICQLCYLSYMLVFTAQTGLSLGRGRVFPRYIFTLCASAVAGTLCTLATVFLALTGTVCSAVDKIDVFSKCGLLVYVIVSFAFLPAIKAVPVPFEKKAKKEASEVFEEATEKPEE